MIKITKFGGSSVANAEQFRKVKAIIEADLGGNVLIGVSRAKNAGLLIICKAIVLSATVL